jgi:ABC-type uncharacterized transport system substrate-binding protein
MWRLWYEKNIPLHELQEEWTYDEIMRASAVLDMYSAVDTAREAYDKAEMERKNKEIEANAKKRR